MPLKPDLPPAIARSVPTRQRAFQTGRACARLALRQAGFVGADPALAARPDGAPDWPAGWRGSISHTATVAVAAAVAAPPCRALGIDREDLLSPAAAAEVGPTVAAPGELAPLLAESDPVLAVTVLFSAKEALFKALSGSLGGFADFDAAYLHRRTADGLELRLRIDWGAAWPTGTIVPVHVARLSDGAVETLVFER